MGGGRFASDGNDLIRWDLGANSKEKKKRKRRRNVQVRKRSSLNGRSKNLLFCKVEIQKSPVSDFYANSSPAVQCLSPENGVECSFSLPHLLLFLSLLSLHLCSSALFKVPDRTVQQNGDTLLLFPKEEARNRFCALQ